jgi:hypothetical protein
MGWLEPIFANHPQFESTGERFSPRVGGLEITSKYRLRPGIPPEDVRFDNLPFARIAIDRFASSNEPGERENSAGRALSGDAGRAHLRHPSLHRRRSGAGSARPCLRAGADRRGSESPPPSRTTSSPCSGMWRPLSSSGWSGASPPVSAERGIR